MPHRGRTLLVAAVGLALMVAFVLNVLAQMDGDPTIFAAFGEDETPTRKYAEERLGEVFLRGDFGHDGKFFFIQANDPWVLGPEENALVLDRPKYRSQRMLYPVLAGGFGAFGPEAIVWAMLVVNVIAMAVGTWAVSEVAVEMGGSPWWGLAFVLNIGFIAELTISGAGIVAGVLAFLAMRAFLRGSDGAGIALLVGAVLSREAMLIAAAGSALWLFVRNRRRSAVWALVAPLATAAAWALYLNLRIENGSRVPEIEEIGWPLVGFVDATRAGWSDEPLNMFVGFAVLALIVVFTFRILQGRELIGWAFVGFAALALLFTEQVWLEYFNIARGIAPVITAFLLVVFVRNEGPPLFRSSAGRKRTGVRPSV